jgi:hypothetical protein
MTTLKLGYSDPRTDVFGAHPVLGSVLDLNDGQTFVLLAPDGLMLLPPPRTLVPAGNIRTQGERGVRAVYRHSREVTVRLVLGPAANYAALTSTIRTLRAWVNAPPALPVTLQYQPFGASAPVYLDVIGAAADLPESEGDWLRLQLEPLELVFVCRPGMRGDRVTLANAVTNPGFEQGSGPGVVVFNDALANVNAYAVQAGAALTQDTTRFPDTLKAIAGTNLLRYYRLDEASGTIAVDGSNAEQNGTYAGAPTLGVAGSLTGDTDTAVMLNGTTQYVSVPTTGLPTGNGSWSIRARFKSTSASAEMIWHLGSNTAKTAALLYLNAGKLVGDLFSSSITSAGTFNDGAWHSALLTWDGTNLTLYADGTSVASSATAGPDNISYPANGCNLGVQNSSGNVNFFTGSLDEAFIIGGVALSSGNASTLHSAATTAPVSAPHTLQLAAGNRVAFGSPAWGAVNDWQVRFRFNAGVTAAFYLHYTDANNYLAVTYSGTTLALVQVVGGVTNTLASNASIILTNGIWYWLQVTQFPTLPASTSGGTSDPPAVQVSLFADNAGAVGTMIGATLGPVPTFDAVTALVGRPQIAASGAALGLGGAFANVHTVSLFGPGGWSCTPLVGSATGVSSGAWEQVAANTYPNGPVTSAAAARLDLAPAGTVDALWHLYGGGAAANTLAIAIQAAGNVVYASANVKSAGFGNGCTVALKYAEYNAAGALLRSGTLQTVTIAGGVQLAWPAAGAPNLSGHWTTGASCAFVDLQVEVADTVADTVAGNSANGTVWLDNAQAWDSTRLSTTSMPYCETSFAQSPAQLVLTGLLGDLPAPAHVQAGTFVSAWARGGRLTWALGRLGSYRPSAVLASPSHGFYGTTFAPQAAPVLDAAGYGGFYVKATVDTGGWQVRGLSPRLADALGAYHLWTRYRTFDPAPAGVSLRVNADEALHAWYSDTSTLASLGTYFGPYVNPLSAANAWTVCDAGQLVVPAFPLPGLADATQLFAIAKSQWVGTVGGGAEGDASWACLLPVDGSLLLGQVNYPSNSAVATMTGYVWVYADGLLVSQGVASSGSSTVYSLEAASLPNVAHAGGGVGTPTTGAVNVNSGADGYLTLDPTLGTWNGAGVNQAVGVMADEQARVLPLVCEVSYSPLYLEPR